MIQRQPIGIGRTARWLLLLCTVFGLAVMHTFGHAGVEITMAADVGTHQHGMGRPAAVAEPVAMAGAPICAGDRCPDHGSMSGWSVCLAVLSGLAAIMLLAVMLWARRARAGRPGGRPVLAGSAPRPPPTPAAGLTVASNAVLRI